LLIGPVFHREVMITPRRARIFVARAAYVLVLLLLMLIAWMLLTGTQLVFDLGDLARFGMILFQILARLQLALAVFFSGLLAASAVAQEKDRRTLLLLLLTRISNSELVLGKLMASVLNVLVLIVAALPLFMLSALLGGISFGQIGRVFAVTLASVLACGSLGSTLALWREKTFQALATTVLALVLWLALGEIVAAGALGGSCCGLSCEIWAAGFSPWQAILEATRPYARGEPALGLLGTPVNLFLIVAVCASVALNGLAVAMVRVWNPSREARPANPDDQTQPRKGSWSGQPRAAAVSDSTAVGTNVGVTNGHCPIAGDAAPALTHDARTRRVWDNPVIWREMRTWAYGRKILLIRLTYLVLFGLAAGSLVWVVHSGQPIARNDGALALVPLFLLSLVLVNAQAVTALTSERDNRALDLLLVTDLTPMEIVFGKLGGVFYNTKEMVILPMLLCGYLWYVGALGVRAEGLQNLVYLITALAVLYVFAATVGIHAGMNYANSRAAVATSLGTVFFLFVGVATCMRMMLAFSGSFEGQVGPFFTFTLGGGVGLYVALGARNPSTAIGLASFACPFLTFYAITSFLLGHAALVSLVTVLAYGFATAAMLVPAIAEFDVATGRTTIDEQ